MTQNITRMISMSRDNVLSMTAEPEFFETNPGLAELKPQFDDCRAAFDASARKAGCRCRADTQLLTGCVSAFLELLENSRQTNPEIVQQFVRYVAKTDQIDTTGVTIHYARPGSTEVTRYLFP
jgi:CRP-like cAMP-binding protein